MSKTLRIIISIAAGLIFIWFNIATFWWVSSFDSVATAIRQTWTIMTSNWMMLIILSDSVVFLCLIFVWLIGDASKRGWTGYKRWGWIAGILFLGSPALMVYLILRPAQMKKSRALPFDSKRRLPVQTSPNRMRSINQIHPPRYRSPARF